MRREVPSTQRLRINAQYYVNYAGKKRFKLQVEKWQWMKLTAGLYQQASEGDDPATHPDYHFLQTQPITRLTTGNRLPETGVSGLINGNLVNHRLPQMILQGLIVQ